ncbi:hypothetical protein QEN19_001102 [Hanseniaspora menglaensis]
MSGENVGVKKDKKRRRRNYDDIDNQVQKIEESNVTKISDQTKLSGGAQNLEDDDSDDLNDDELDRLMLLEEEKEKLVGDAKEDEEDEEEIDATILEETNKSRRTRGKVIDFKKTAELLNKEKKVELEIGEEDEEDDDDDDDDADYVPEE